MRQDIIDSIIDMYVNEKMSANEITKILFVRFNLVITARSVQRHLKARGLTRTVGDSFRLAMSQGRIKWAFKDPRLKAKRNRLPDALRYQILKRDDYRCVWCGMDKSGTILEIDHIIPLCNGGLTEINNLRTLCHSCNVGKRITEKEV